MTFGNTETRQVMRPRIDIFGLKKDLSYSEVLQRVTEKGIQEFLFLKIQLIRSWEFSLSKTCYRT